MEERDAAVEAARAATAERGSMASSHRRHQRRWDAEVHVRNYMASNTAMI